ncbi:MAG: AAA-like domain-containing protein [Cyanobacteria bacterium J06626_4]
MILVDETSCMDPEEVLLSIENRFLKRKLNPAERIVLGQTWNKQTYEQMARHSGYGDAHLKDTGYKLWREISQVLGQRVTKKSLLFVLKEHMQQIAAEADNAADISQSEVLEVTQNTLSQVPYPSGPLSPDSPLYVDRPPNDDIAHREIQRPGGFLRVKAPRKMGKTSLVFRLMQTAQAQGYQTAHLDLQTIDEAIFVNTETFLKWFCLRVSQELGIFPELDTYWDSSMGYKVSSELYFQEHILGQSHKPIVLIISAAEELIQHSQIAQDFFPLLRYWHEKARWSSIWQTLRMVIAHATEIYVPLKIHQSPFNIGQAIKLPGFTAAQVAELAKHYGLKTIDRALAQRIFEMLGGHPYLVNVFFYHLVTESTQPDTLFEVAATPSGIYGAHLRNYLAILKQSPNLAQAMHQVVSTQAGAELDAVTMYRLESLGLIKINGYRAMPGCEVYRSYFQQQLDL